MKIIRRHEMLVFSSWKKFHHHEISNPSWNVIISRHEKCLVVMNSNSGHEIFPPSWITIRRHEVHFFPSWKCFPRIMKFYSYRHELAHFFQRHEMMNFSSWKNFPRHEIPNRSWNVIISRHEILFLPSWISTLCNESVSSMNLAKLTLFLLFYWKNT